MIKWQIQWICHVYSLDGSGLWKFRRWTSTITGAGGKVGERVSVGQGEAFALPIVVILTCSLEARLRFQNLCQVFLTWTPAIRAAGKRWRIRGQNQGPAVSVCRYSECGFNLYMCVCVWLRRSKTIENVPVEKDIRMKKLGDKVTNSMDLPCSLDGIWIMEVPSLNQHNHRSWRKSWSKSLCWPRLFARTCYNMRSHQWCARHVVPAKNTHKWRFDILFCPLWSYCIVNI